MTIYAGGPLTNLALAIALAPDIVPLVPEVVIMGTGFHVFTNTFNIFFDPEAARKGAARRHGRNSRSSPWTSPRKFTRAMKSAGPQNDRRNRGARAEPHFGFVSEIRRRAAARRIRRSDFSAWRTR